MGGEAALFTLMEMLQCSILYCVGCAVSAGACLGLNSCRFYAVFSGFARKMTLGLRFCRWCVEFVMNESTCRVLLAQRNVMVGDVAGNAAVVLEAAQLGHSLGAHIVLLPELALAGYPPEDLLFHSGFRHQMQAAVRRICDAALPVDMVFGYPEYRDDAIFNSAVWVSGGHCLANYQKATLPNYRVFDEKRYFAAGAEPTVVSRNGVRFGVLVCEDMWEPQSAARAVAAGAEVLLVLNASPFEVGKLRERERVARQRVQEVGCPLVYLNLVGGQDELVFDGNSFVLASDGTVTHRLPAWQEASALVEFCKTSQCWEPVPGVVAPELDVDASVYEALVLGVRDYVGKNRFPGVVLGLSGGIDSALTLAIAVDALGAEHVHAVMMPSRHTSQMSIDYAAQQARALGVRHSSIGIEAMYGATLDSLAAMFEGAGQDTTEENIQARCRGLLLMAISNKTGSMVLTTGNKSEMSVGYATLYGDMAGGFAPIKDCSKLLVYRLALHRNALSPVIPERVIARPPSAELRPDQKDTDSLPPYEVMDPILEAFIEDDLSVDEIVARGFERAVVTRILAMVKRNEYKRRQAPPGVRISSRAFGRDWRYPITSGYKLS